MGIFLESGGLHYHWRAWRNSRRLWGPTRNWLEAEMSPFVENLSVWKSPSTPQAPVVIFGPSGLYLWRSALITQLARSGGPIQFYDLDPLARYFAIAAHKTATPELRASSWSSRNWLEEFRQQPSRVDDWMGELNCKPSGIIFNGLLAQLLLEGWTNGEIIQLWNELESRQIPLLSLHDLWVLPRSEFARAPNRFLQNEPSSFSADLSLAGLLDEIRAREAADAEVKSEVSREIFIEQFESVHWASSFSGIRRRSSYCLWPLEEARIHVLQIISNRV